MKPLTSALLLLALDLPAWAHDRGPITTSPVFIDEYAKAYSTAASATNMPAHSIAQATTTSIHLQYPSQTFQKRSSVCPQGLNFCDGANNCCPAGAYCTVDAQGQGACCSNGAYCTGSSEPVPGIVTGAGPPDNAGEVLRPSKFFSLLAHLASFSSRDTVDKSNDSPTEDPTNGTSTEDKKGGRGGRGGWGRGGGSSAHTIRPLRIFSLPVVLSRHVKVAFGYTNDDARGLKLEKKFTGPNVAVILSNNATSGCAGRTQPLRLFGVAASLAHQARAALSEAAQAVSDTKPKVKFMGTNPGAIKAQENTTNGAVGPIRPARVFSLPFVLAQQVKAVLPAATKEPVRSQALHPTDNSHGSLIGRGPSTGSNDSIKNGLYWPSFNGAGAIRPHWVLQAVARIFG